jgi:hypothetical protein
MLLRLPEAVVKAILATPPVQRVVPEAVFDAFGWCPSDTLEWGRPEGFDVDAAIGGDNPPGMAFILRAPCDYLPRELGRLHVPGLGLVDEWALAPYAIDDATDELHARRVRPGGLLWLAARDLAGLFWGLHDWAHFHNHGPFEERAWTELQCDLSALVWLRLNAEVAGIDGAAWERARTAVEGVARKRFADEGLPPADGVLSAERVASLADSLG